MNALLFLENKEDAEKAAQLKKNEELTIIALDPEAAYALEKNNISFNTQDDYFAADEYLKLGLENFNKVEQFCKYCDLFLKENINFLKENNIEPSFYHYFSFKILFDIAASKICVLKKIIEKNKPSKIYFFDNGREETVNETFLFENKSPFSEPLKILCKHYNAEFKIINTKKNPAAEAVNPPKSKKNNVVLYIYRMFRKIFDNLFGKYEQLPVVFMTSPSYDLSYIAKLIKKKKNARILCFEPETDIAPHFIFPSWEKLKITGNNDNVLPGADFDMLWVKLLKNKEFRDFFILRGVDIFPIVETRLKYFFTVFAGKLMNLYLMSVELFKAYKPKIFFTPHTHRGRMKILTEAARKSGIPVAVYQHGGVYGYSEYTFNSQSDIQYCDYLISFGEGVKQRYPLSGAKIIPVGSFLLHDISRKNTVENKIETKRRLGINKGKKVVVYVMNPIFRSWKYIDYLYYTDHECFNSQRKIIDVFAKHDEYQYILKIFPCYNEKDPIVPYIKDKKKENFMVIWDKFFKYIMPCADLIVMDAVSTPLLEALTTNQKIMIYDLYKSTFPDAVEVLRKRAYYSDNIDEYLNELDKELAKGDFEIKNPNNDFSELYGKYEDLTEMNAKIKSFLNEKINNG